MSKAVIIAGTKSYDDYETVKKTVLNYLKDHYIDINDVEIISGDVPGASSLGKRFAQEYRLALSKFYAMPDVFGDAANYVRDKEMAEYAEDRDGVVFAFWDGASKGTKTMLNLAKQHNLELHTLLYKGEVISPKAMLDYNAVFGLCADKGQNNVIDNMNDLYDIDPSIRSF